MLHMRVYFSRMCYQIAPRVLHFSAFIISVWTPVVTAVVHRLTLPGFVPSLPSCLGGLVGRVPAIDHGFESRSRQLRFL